MNLGTLDTCLKVKNYIASRDFYLNFGFVEFECGDGWGVLVNGHARLGLYEENHMGEDDVTLHLRQGEVEAAQAVADRMMLKPYYRVSTRGKSLQFRDPDGRLIMIEREG